MVEIEKGDEQLTESMGLAKGEHNDYPTLGNLSLGPAGRDPKYPIILRACGHEDKARAQQDVVLTALLGHALMCIRRMSFEREFGA